MLKLLKIEKF